MYRAGSAPRAGAMHGGGGRARGFLGSGGFGSTSRRDAWWVAPLAVFLGLGTFVAYSTWAAFQNAHYTFGPYLSPFYAPVLWASPDNPAGLAHAWFGAK